MHIKVGIPKQRRWKDGEPYNDRGLSSNISKTYTVPLEEISLHQWDTHQREYSEARRMHIDIAVTYYFIKLNGHHDYYVEDEIGNRRIFGYEIHESEYKRISNILEKLNLVEIEEHNVKAVLENAPEKVINRGEMNGLSGLEVE